MPNKKREDVVLLRKMNYICNQNLKLIAEFKLLINHFLIGGFLMKRFLIIMLILVCSFAFAQEKATSVAEGSKALLFSFRGLDFLNAGEFNGGVGGKLFIANDLALRVGLRLDSYTETTPANEDTNEVGKDGEYSDFTFGVSAAVEWHLTANRVSPYLGGGVSYSNSSMESFPARTWDRNYTGIVTRTKTETSGVGGFSVFGIAGVEIFIIKEISLSAEYHFAYTTTSEGEVKQTTSLIQGTDPTYPRSDTVEGDESSSYGFRSAGFLTLAVYL